MKLSQLKKMKMPEKKPELDLSELDSSDPSSDPEAEEGSPQEEASETPAEESHELDAIPDDLLLAEVKKRGLMSQMDGDSSSNPEDMNEQNQ